MAIKDFEALNDRLAEAGEKTYQNPRNTAAGSLRQLDPSLTATRPLRLLTYAIIQTSGQGPRTQWETLQLLREYGFPVSDICRYCPDFESALKVCAELMEQRDQWSFEADGLVIKINQHALATDLGVAGKDPRGAVGVKIPRPRGDNYPPRYWGKCWKNRCPHPLCHSRARRNRRCYRQASHFTQL